MSGVPDTRSCSVALTLSAFDSLIERRIDEAVARGELDDLPGAGRPLDLDQDLLVPPDVRMAHRILKNAGFVPPEVDLRREIAELERVCGELGEQAPGGTRARLLSLRLRLSIARGGRGITPALAEYAVQIVDRLAGGR
jgi:Domain of unknown function (DUF1992)